MPGERLDFLPHQIVDMIFALEKVMEHLLGFGKSAPLVRETGEIFFFQPVENQMGQVRNAALRQANQRIKPFFAASFCLASKNIL